MRIANAFSALKHNIYAIIIITACIIMISDMIIFEADNNQYFLGLQATSSNYDNNNNNIGNDDDDDDNANVNYTNNPQSDRFGIKKIYETKSGGREWYVNMEDPHADPWFILGAVDLQRQPDGSWRLGGTDIDDQFNDKYHIIIGANTPPWQEEWRDVEITGYAKIVSASDDEDEDEVGLQWYARGANHTDEVPCDGTSLKGRLLVDGTANWKKEIWHDGGYTDERGTEQATDQSIMDRWVGWKVIMYNIENNTAVKMESYVDDNDDNNWEQVTDLIDDNGWFASSSDEEFYGADCGLPKDYVVTNSGPVASFRSDGILWDFRNLSIREIQPPLFND